MLPSLSSTLVSAFATTHGVGAGLAPSSPTQSTDHFLRMVRVCFDPNPSGTPSCRSIGGLMLLVLNLQLLRSAASKSQTFPWSFGTATQRIPWRHWQWRHHNGPKRSFLASSECRHVLACTLRKPISSKKTPRSHSQFLSSVTGAVQALSQQPTLPTAWSSSVSFGKLDVDFALWRASLPPEMTLRWTNRIGSSVVFIRWRPIEILCSDTRTYSCSFPPSLYRRGSYPSPSSTGS